MISLEEQKYWQFGKLFLEALQREYWPSSVFSTGMDQVMFLFSRNIVD